MEKHQAPDSGASKPTLERSVSFQPRWEPVDEDAQLSRVKTEGLNRGLALRPIVSASKEIMATDLSVSGFVPKGSELEDVDAGVYGRFSQARKRGIIAMVAMTSIITRRYRYQGCETDKAISFLLCDFLPCYSYHGCGSEYYRNSFEYNGCHLLDRNGSHSVIMGTHVDFLR